MTEETKLPAGIKKLVPIKPVELRGFEIPLTRDGLAELFTALIGGHPVTVQEVPLAAGSTGIALQLSHNELHWHLTVQSGDWLVCGEDGNIEAFAPSLMENFRTETLQ